MAGGQTIDLGEVFSIVGSTASGVGGALAGSSASSTATPVAPPLDLAPIVLGAAAGAGIAMALDKSPAMGAVGGAFLGYLVGAMPA